MSRRAVDSKLRRLEAGARRGGVRKEQRWTGFRSQLGPDIRQFIGAKRAVGRKYGGEERILRLFDAYLADHGVSSPEELTVALVDQFVTSRAPAAIYFKSLHNVVRRLLKWLIVQERMKHVDFARRSRRVVRQRVPFIFNVQLARRLLVTAGKLPDAGSVRRRGATYRTLFALYCCLGLRASEGCQLRCADVDFDRNVLTVQGKFGKTRLVPFGAKIARLLREQVEYRSRYAKSLKPNSPLFTFDGRRCVHAGNVSATFLALVRSMRLEIPDGVAAPRLHDLRHSFAVGTLLRWYRKGINAADRLHYLSAFMGHADPAYTAVYLTITNDLLKAANRRFERFASKGARK